MTLKNPVNYNMASQLKNKATSIREQLTVMFPDAQCELLHGTPFQLLIAVMLSAQTTDQAVNKVTPALFARFPDAFALAKATEEDIETLIKTIGLYHSKAKNAISTSKIIAELYQGNVPNNRELLEELPGVGRKTTNVVLSVAFHVPAIAVDTHVERVSKRLGFAPEKASPRDVEEKLMRIFDQDYWHQLHHQLIFLGRYRCKAKKPQCEGCLLQMNCKYYQQSIKNTLDLQHQDR